MQPQRARAPSAEPVANQERDMRSTLSMAGWVAVGAGVGAALGVATGALAVGVGIGVALGSVIGALHRRRTPRR
jgi:hypothetical protein